MERLIEIKNRLEVIEKSFNEQYPRFRNAPELTEQITDLKDHVEAERKKIQKQKRKRVLSDFECSCIEPAINDVYLSSLDRIRCGLRPDNSVSGYIYETSSTLTYWLHQIDNHIKSHLI